MLGRLPHASGMHLSHALSCAVALTLLTLVAPRPACAQESAPVVAQQEGDTAATAIQRALIAQHARLRALAERFGAEHPDARTARATVASLATSLRAELAARGRIDRAKIREWVRVQLADADAQLASMRVTYAPAHIDVRVAQARRTAIEEALRAFERDGRFFSDASQ